MLGHVGRRPGKDFLTFLQHWSGAVTCPAVDAAGVAAGPNALRGSGPNHFHALEGAMTQAGSPDPWNDHVCITSSCPRQFVEHLAEAMPVPVPPTTSLTGQYGHCRFKPLPLSLYLFFELERIRKYSVGTLTTLTKAHLSLLQLEFQQSEFVAVPVGYHRQVKLRSPSSLSDLHTA